MYTKDCYKRTIGRWNNTTNNGKCNNNNSFFYFLIPEIRYSYIPPGWINQRQGSKALAKGKETTAPFPSFWYVSSHQISQVWLEETFGRSGQIWLKCNNKSKLRYANLSKDIPRDFKGEFDKSKKRPNPKAQKRLAALKRAVTGSSSSTANNLSSLMILIKWHCSIHRNSSLSMLHVHGIVFTGKFQEIKKPNIMLKYGTIAINYC